MRGALATRACRQPGGRRLAASSTGRAILAVPAASSSRVAADLAERAASPIRAGAARQVAIDGLARAGDHDAAGALAEERASRRSPCRSAQQRVEVHARAQPAGDAALGQRARPGRPRTTSCARSELAAAHRLAHERERVGVQPPRSTAGQRRRPARRAACRAPSPASDGANGPTSAIASPAAREADARPPRAGSGSSPTMPTTGVG